MIDKDIINTFVRTDIDSAKKVTNNDNFFTKSAYEIIPEFANELNLNFNNNIIPKTATKTFSG